MRDRAVLLRQTCKLITWQSFYILIQWLWVGPKTFHFQLAAKSHQGRGSGKHTWSSKDLFLYYYVPSFSLAIASSERFLKNFLKILERRGKQRKAKRKSSDLSQPKPCVWWQQKRKVTGQCQAEEEQAGVSRQQVERPSQELPTPHWPAQSPRCFFLSWNSHVGGVPLCVIICSKVSDYLMTKQSWKQVEKRDRTDAKGLEKCVHVYLEGRKPRESRALMRLCGRKAKLTWVKPARNRTQTSLISQFGSGLSSWSLSLF